MRSDDVKESYLQTKIFKEDLFAIGDQMRYEWEQDFRAMKWALLRIDEFLKIAKEHNYFTGTLHIAKDELVNRMMKYSCPSNLKDQYKTKENCPSGDNCKCFNQIHSQQQ